MNMDIHNHRSQPDLPADNDDNSLTQKIFSDKVRLLYDQIPVGVSAQLIVASCLVYGLWNVSDNQKLVIWLLIVIGSILAWLMCWYLHRSKKSLLTDRGWLIATAAMTFLSGLEWGYATSMLMPAQSIIHQAFVIIIEIGMTAGAIPFFSPVLTVYALYLLGSFIPLTIWMFIQGDIYTLLGFCAIVYILVALASCYYSNQFLTTSLSLSYKNINLDLLNQLLEQRVTERTGALEKSLALTKSTLESTADGILVVDLENRLEYYNQQFIKMWNLPPGTSVPPKLEQFKEEIRKQVTDAPNFLAKMTELQQNLAKTGLGEISLKNNNQFFEWYSKAHKIGDRIAGRVWSFRDITLRKGMEQQLSYQATHDELTGLPNRMMLYEQINNHIITAQRTRKKLVLFFLDIDNFKLINDSLGHEAGDILLQKTASRLQDCVYSRENLARFGGDEFAMLFLVESSLNQEHLAQHVLDTIRQPMQVVNRDIVVSTSIGICFYPDDGHDPATLLKNADMAMYQAKKMGRNNYKFYDGNISKKMEKSLETQIEIRNAFTNQEFFIKYQPIISLETGNIIGAEALLRWQHPTKGLILPLNFIPTAEESGLINSIGEWVFNEVCKQNKIWQNTGLPAIKTAINVSGIQFQQEHFIEFVQNCLSENRLNANAIELELTESTIMTDKKQNLQTLKQLHELGINLSIDDFGTGYSSLHYLKEFPVSKLKIAQPFLVGCPDNLKNASLVEAIIAMGHSLKLKVAATGIENDRQLEFLRAQGCDDGQGFYFGEAVSAEQFEGLLRG
ncbi:EAL domain-containing protein [Legionella dresdenensis]|uniref:EAL domain-containing protein n=1 Tax=Legionella dresdenensis TaxID=450200 RepID=A0ABV8CFE4_9GAMM